MEHDVVIAGHGGQGVKLMGHLLATAAFREGKTVLEYVLYSGAVRGGPIRCTVVISNEEIGSPVRGTPEAIVALDQRAFKTYGPNVALGGLVIRNASLTSDSPLPHESTVFPLDAGAAARGLGNELLSGMICLGAFVRLTGWVEISSVTDAVREILPVHRQAMVAANLKAILLGAEMASPVQAYLGMQT